MVIIAVFSLSENLGIVLGLDEVPPLTLFIEVQKSISTRRLCLSFDHLVCAVVEPVLSDHP